MRILKISTKTNKCNTKNMTKTSLGVAKAGNLKFNFVAKSIGIHFFGFKDIFRCYRDNENLKQHFGRMDTNLYVTKDTQ